MSVTGLYVSKIRLGPQMNEIMYFLFEHLLDFVNVPLQTPDCLHLNSANLKRQQLHCRFLFLVKV